MSGSHSKPSDPSWRSLLNFNHALRIVAGLFCAIVLTACSGGNSGKVDDDTEAPDTDVPVQPQSPDDVVSVGEQIPAEQQRLISISEAGPYRAGQYAQVLSECALAELASVCTLEKLPYIGQVNPNPTVDDVMQRLVVSHDWMAVRFEELLRRMPADMTRLFAPVTVLVIASDVRPSRFSSARGAVYLDPRYLWLSNEEKQTISTDSDPRSGFGSDLKFVGWSRSTIGNDLAFFSWSLTDDRERGLDDIELALARLLFHELGHANDYVQYDKLAQLNSALTPDQTIDELLESRVSYQLEQEASLTSTSSYLYGLAGVRFLGRTATDFQRNILADFAGAEMSAEGKTGFYSYSTEREDVAMLFDATMMKLHYNVDTHVAYLNKPDMSDPSCNDYKVSWGVRNRLAAPLVVPRARFVVDRILPSSSARIDSFFSSRLGSAIPLREGAGWCDSRYLNPSSASAAKAASGKRAPEGTWWMMERDYE